jgi:hypothetical protein
MHSRELARRGALAHERILAAAETLAKKHKLPGTFVAAIQTVTAKDARVRALYQREAIADLLEALVDPKAAAKAFEEKQKVEEPGDEDAPDLAEIVEELSKE